jgi:hypothetical protein
VLQGRGEQASSQKPAHSGWLHVLRARQSSVPVTAVCKLAAGPQHWHSHAHSAAQHTHVQCAIDAFRVAS